MSVEDDLRKLTKRVEALEAAARGECQECGQRVAGYKPAFGSFAPEIWATMRERGIDPVNGHEVTCGSKGSR